ncbi:MAG: hypothetical protein STSR0009_26750 [Methanoregula sp.]
MMIVECYNDEYLIRKLATGVKIKHEKGIGNVVLRTFAHTNVIGMIDEDGTQANPRLFQSHYILIEDAKDMKIYRKNNDTMNLIVELCPALEGWLINRASRCGLLMRDFGLPDNRADLFKLKRLDGDKRYDRFLNAVIPKDEQLQKLKRLIQKIAV